MQAQRALVLVARGVMESTPVTVFHHEVPILKAIHGDGNATILTVPDGFDLGPVTTLDPDQEYNRLANRYGQHSSLGVPMVEYVYGPPGENRLSKAGMAPQPEESKDKQKEFLIAELKAFLNKYEIVFNPRFSRSQLLTFSGKHLREQLTAKSVDFDEKSTVRELAKAFEQVVPAKEI